jgi:hypothetical protein
MNSFVILAKNTKVFGGHHFRVSFTKASFNIGRVSPDGVSRMNRMGSPAVMAGELMVMDAPISILTRHAFSLSVLRPVDFHGRVF